MTWKSRILILAIVLFLACNVVLLIKGGGKISRTFYIDKWTAVKEQNILQTMKTKGVYAPKEEQHVYYEGKTGSFNGFLVEKGDSVEPGTGLFEYSPADITLTKEQFEIEKEKLERELTSLDDHIYELESMRDELLLAPVDEETAANNEYMIQTMERDIAEKELQRSKIESEITKYEDLIVSAEESLVNLKESSEISGTVKEIKHDLTNPVLTIISNEQRIEGMLTEEEVKRIAEGMKVFITTESGNNIINGTIEKISTYPTSKPDVKKESQYAFTVTLDEIPEKESFHGEHVSLKIVTNEIIDTLTIPSQSIKKKSKNQYAYTIENTGKLERKEIQTGLKIDETQEIKAGLEKGEWVVLDRPPFLKAGYPIITPMDPAKMSKKGFKNLTKKEMLIYAAKGFISR